MNRELLPQSFFWLSSAAREKDRKLDLRILHSVSCLGVSRFHGDTFPHMICFVPCILFCLGGFWFFIFFFALFLPDKSPPLASSDRLSATGVSNTVNWVIFYTAGKMDCSTESNGW